jgi:hypothetical protein
MQGSRELIGRRIEPQFCAGENHRGGYGDPRLRRYLLMGCLVLLEPNGALPRLKRVTL